MQNVEQLQRLWAEFVGVDPDEQDVHKLHFQKRDMIADLREAQELDPSDLLFVMLLEEKLDQRLADIKVSALEYLDEPASFDLTLARAKKLRQLIATSGMIEARVELRANVGRALEHYRAADRPDVQNLLSKRGSIAYLWRDALKALATTLQVHQFLQGAPEPKGTRPQYQEHVLGFFSVNDAIRLSANMPSGIALCLIRDREAIQSFFAFVIRNGANLTVVTDATAWTHPLQRRMSRRPDRQFEERIGRSRFPYDLLQYEILRDEDGEYIGINVPRQEGLVPHQTRAYKVKPVREIAPDEVVWTAMMFALMTRRFFVENFQAPKLSFTGEMVELPHLIEKTAVDAGLPVPAGSYHPIMLKPLTSTALTGAFVASEGKIEDRKVAGLHAWMEERYAGQVDDGLLNIIRNPDGRVLEIGQAGQLTRLTEKEIEERRWHGGRHDVGIRLHEFDATTFGHADDLQADRIFIARYNQAQAIAMLAKTEYEKRRDEVAAWWKAAIEKNKDFLFEAMKRGTLPTAKLEGDASFGNRHSYLPRHLAPGLRELLQRHEFSELKIRNNFSKVPRLRSVSLGALEQKGNSFKHRCAISDRPATGVAFFTPLVAADLALLAGLKVEDLPDVIQHWQANTPYVGNSILDRLDPMDWAIEDPWKDLPFEVSVYVSRYAIPPLTLEPYSPPQQPDDNEPDGETNSPSI